MSELLLLMIVVVVGKFCWFCLFMSLVVWLVGLGFGVFFVKLKCIDCSLLFMRVLFV